MLPRARPWIAALASLAACRDPSPRAISRNDAPQAGIAQSVSPPISATVAPSIAPSTPPPPSAPPVPPTPAVVEKLLVPSDSPAFVVRGAASPAPRIVFLPGLCSNAYAYLLSFPEAARAHGGVVAIDGNEPCGAPGSGFHSFTWSRDLQRTRIDRALAAAGVAEIPAGGLTLVGYSAGSSIAEMIHQQAPERFPRLVLISPPIDVAVTKLGRARGVVTMSCSTDVPGRMKEGKKRLLAANVPSIYLEMPGCTHGNIADGERVFGEAFDWLDTR
jgi:pimeloyl-ACP methyl ester carboxylesterase